MWPLFELILLAACATALPLGNADEEHLLSALTVRQTGSLPSSFQWSSSGVLVSPKDDGRGVQNIKDPSIVFYGGKYHVFASVYTTGYSELTCNLVPKERSPHLWQPNSHHHCQSKAHVLAVNVH